MVEENERRGTAVKDVNIPVQDYMEVLACIEIIQRFSEKPGLMNNRYKLREIKRFANMAEKYLERSAYKEEQK